MSNSVITPGSPAENIEKALARGDMSALSAEERILYLRQVCASLGLNPLTGPFEYVNLGGKLRLYARKDAADQLRKIHGVNVEVVSREVVDDCLVVHVRATMPAAADRPVRTDEDLGVVYLGKLAGENRANAIMRAITKAKRRVTMSICGLGFLDETEVADVLPAATSREIPLAELPQTVAEIEALPTPTKATDEQLAAMRRLKDALGIDADAWGKALAKRGVTTARDLTPAQADELTGALQYRLSAADMERDIKGETAPLHVAVPVVGKDAPAAGGEATGDTAQATFLVP